MDITEQPPTVLSLCSGYGGLEIGLKRVFGEIAVLAHVEIEAFAVANLVNKMETEQMAPVPIWTDVKTFDAKPFRGCVDILTGGYPCQPFSVAGQRKGADDPRHLWPHIRRIIGECRPGWVFLENVEGHLTKGVAEVLADLEKMAYRPECGVFSAAEVGAPHQRKRMFILAHDDDGGRRKSEICPKQPRGTGIVGASENVAHNTSIGWGERRPESARQQRRSGASSGSCEGSAQLGGGTPRVTNNGGCPSPQCTGRGSRIEDQVVMFGLQDQDNSSTHGKRREQWLTSHANCSTGAGRQGRQGGENLQTKVANWPIPRTCSGKKSSGAPRTEFYRKTVNPGKLNPNWVEQLMGISTGWTALDYSATE